MRLKKAACAALIAISTSGAIASAPTPGAPLPAGWHRAGADSVPGAGTYRIAVPAAMKSVPVTGIDSYVSEYRSLSLKLLLDFGLYGSSGVAECRRHSPCAVGTIMVDGVRASRARYRVPDPDGGLPYRTTYNIPFGPRSPKPGGVTLTIWAECASASACALADRIVRTIEILPDH